MFVWCQWDSLVLVQLKKNPRRIPETVCDLIFFRLTYVNKLTKLMVIKHKHKMNKTKHIQVDYNNQKTENSKKIILISVI